MLVSNLFLTTTREAPSEAELISHKLMLQSGMIEKLASGLYTWLPLGLRVLRKVERIVRTNMDAIGANEIFMPMVQPAELWQTTARWNAYGPSLLKVADRHNRDFCLGPTHEEVITDLAKKKLKSYKQLPVIFYQIQTKFRDEIRPRFGVMRAREFLMKDAYSFALTIDELKASYELMHDTYCKIFNELGLNFRAVEADSGAIGDGKSQEFHVLADSGEDKLAIANESSYASNVELAECVEPVDLEQVDAELRIVEVNSKIVDEQAKQLARPKNKMLKTLLLAGENTDAVAVVIPGDSELNLIKIAKHPEVMSPARLLTTNQAEAVAGTKVGFIGPVGLNVPVIIDRAAVIMRDCACGANIQQKCYVGLTPTRDITNFTVWDCRNIKTGDLSPCGNGNIKITRGIEVGHIFQLGDKYSAFLKATVLNEQGRENNLQMGCYGIGVSRIVAAAIEQNHDERGIIWPQSMAPFTLCIVAIGYHKSKEVKLFADNLYATWKDRIDCLLDDRNIRPGVMFADMDLIGIPHRLVISEKTLQNKEVEYKNRANQETTMVVQDNIDNFIAELVTNL